MIIFLQHYKFFSYSLSSFHRKVTAIHRISVHFHVILITINSPKETLLMTNATKLALEESLKHLLLKKPLDKITITT